MLDATPAPSSTAAASRSTVDRPALTARELTVLTLVVDGLTNPQIAERLVNSPRTVQTHVQSLLRKFGMQTRTELAVAALRSGLVPLHPPSGADPASMPLAA